MRKSLRRILDRLRSATNEKLRKRTSVRGGLEQAQRLQPLPVTQRVSRR